MTQSHSAVCPPWWKFGHVWLVISGPAIVVVASFITLYLALTRMDPVLDEDYYRKGININKTLSDHPGAMVPAVQGRNHLSSDVPLRPKAP
jgi:uncharacterized protein